MNENLALKLIYYHFGYIHIILNFLKQDEVLNYLTGLNSFSGCFLASLFKKFVNLVFAETLSVRVVLISRLNLKRREENLSGRMLVGLRPRSASGDVPMLSAVLARLLTNQAPSPFHRVTAT